jgi:56kDa selenium binding protein (SBP56)
MDANTFELKGPWEKDRGTQRLAYDFRWHLGHDNMITSDWGTPNMVKNRVNPGLLLAGKYGHKIMSGTGTSVDTCRRSTGVLSNNGCLSCVTSRSSKAISVLSKAHFESQI